MGDDRVASRHDRRRWLCVAYAFPPINRSGTHRTLGFVRHVSRAGWDADVVTVEPGDEPCDASLAALVPPDTRVLRAPCVDIIERTKRMLGMFGTVDVRDRPRVDAGVCAVCHTHQNTGHACEHDMRVAAGRGHSTARSHGLRAVPRVTLRTVPDLLTRLMTTPDPHVGWIPPAIRRALGAIRRARPDVIYSTSPSLSAHVVALVASRWSGVPWVADFRDPWGGNPFRPVTHRAVARWDAWLERHVVHGAAHIVCTTPTMRDLLCRRFPSASGKTTVIPNGFDAELVEGLAPRRVTTRDVFALVHSGQFYGPRSPHVWFRALRRARQRDPAAAGNMRMVLVGSTDYDGRPLTDIAAAAGVADCVDVVGPRRHADALAIAGGADAVMLGGVAGDGGSLQVPNKLFEYIAMRRPILAAVAPESPVIGILGACRAEAVVCAPDDDVGLADGMIRLARGVPFGVSDAWSGVGNFRREVGASALADIFERVTAPACHMNRAGDGAPPAVRRRPAPAGRPRAAACAAATRAPAPRPSVPVSVIMTVRDDVAGLETVLESLGRQTRPPDDIVIVDGGSDAAALARMRALVRRYAGARLITGRPCNIAEGRNRAIAAARHDVIACIDAGCRADADWLARITAPFSEEHVDCVGGVYTIEPRGRFERVVGLLTMPGQLMPLDPQRFNPSARSMAFRRGVWRSAGGFPEWLYTAEDTLFDLRLRSMRPPVRYVVARDAVVAWRPRTTLRGVFRQFYGYARGSAHIGRGTASHRYTTLRYVAACVWTAAAVVGWATTARAMGWVAAAVVAGVLARPHMHAAWVIARRYGGWVDFVTAVGVGEWVALARWFGHRRGRRDRRRAPERYVGRLVAYVGAASVDGPIPPWAPGHTPGLRVSSLSGAAPSGSADRTAAVDRSASRFAERTPADRHRAAPLVT
ncbi:MAG: glycosyltransferase [Phycisphaerae bacterium]